jgi:hypothetical protein
MKKSKLGYNKLSFNELIYKKQQKSILLWFYLFEAIPLLVITNPDPVKMNRFGRTQGVSLYSQTCVQRPPLGPENMVVMQRVV